MRCDAAARILSWQGHTVIRANHLGDWGTQFGMLIEHLIDVDAPAGSLADLTAFYAAARATFDADAGFRDRARRRVVALQGDPTEYGVVEHPPGVGVARDEIDLTTRREPHRAYRIACA